MSRREAPFSSVLYFLLKKQKKKKKPPLLCLSILEMWASRVTQLVKNWPVMQETWVRSLGWEDPLEKGKATYSSILAWRIPWIV